MRESGIRKFIKLQKTFQQKNMGVHAAAAAASAASRAL
jgi:hypothetical protein